jgi:hypothetical protein
MKRLLVALSILLIAQTTFAAVQYEFRQTSRADTDSIPPSDFTARAILDGQRSRVDVIAGNAYPPGTYVISTNGSKNLTFVDPTLKQYVEVNAASAAASIGARKIVVDNARHSVQKLDDHPIIAGQPTDHYRLTLDYDMTLLFGTIPIKQNIHTQIDKWTTVVFGDLTDTFSAASLRTGNQQLDDLLDLETTKIKGFALHETMTTVTTNSRTSVPGSQLQISPSHTKTREIMVTAIQEITPGKADFIVPTAFHRVDPGAVEKKGPNVTTLSLEPAGSDR